MKKLKLDRKMSVRLAVLSMTGMLFVTGLGGCSKKNNNDEKQATSITNINGAVTKVETSKEVLNQVKNVTKSLNNNIKDKFYLNDDDQISAITLLNIDYIVSNGEETLNELYPDGLNTKKELNDLETFISKYREYTRTLKNTDEFISLSDYALLDKDKIVTKELENMTKEVINLVNNKGSKEEINSIYNKIYGFFAEGKSLTINDKEYTKQDLSNGFRFASEAFASTINVLSRNYIDEKKRTSLDDRLRTTDSVYQLQVLMQVFGNTTENVKETMIDNNDTYILDDSDIKVINSFNTKYNTVSNDIKGKFDASTDEISSIIQIANIDYLASDNVSAGAMKTVIDKDLKVIFKNASSFIKKAQKYNESNLNNLYIYSDLFMNDEENLVNLEAIKGSIKTTLQLKNEINAKSDYSTIFNNKNFQFIKLYNQYSSDVNINSNGSKITKNDTGFGTRFITNSIYNRSLNQLPVKFDAIIDLVDDDKDDLSVLPIINTMIDDKCSKYQYVK